MPSTFRLVSFEDELQLLKKSLVALLPLSSQILNILNLKIQKRLQNESAASFYVFKDAEKDFLERNESEENDVIISKHPFVLCIQRPNVHSIYGVFVFAPPNPSSEMMKTFENFIEWDKVRTFCSVDQSFFSNHLKELCLKYGELVRPDGIPCESYAMDIEAAKSYALPVSGPNDGADEKGYEVKELSVSDATEVLRNYTFAQAHSKPEVEACIRNLTSAGIYVESELASSALLSPAGLLNILYTDEKHRRKGFGNVVLQTLSKNVASIGLFPMAECEIWNASSRHVILKSGLRFNSFTNWVHYKGFEKVE